MKLFISLFLTYLVSGILHAQPLLMQGWRQLNQQVVDLYLRGKYIEALPIAQQAIGQAEKEFGKKHPAYAGSLYNMALLDESLGQFTQALPLYQQALLITEQTLGKQHPDYMQSLYKLAVLYDSMSQYDKALPLFQEALQIKEQVVGKIHPDYAQSLNNLANLYFRMGHCATPMSPTTGRLLYWSGNYKNTWFRKYG